MADEAVIKIVIADDPAASKASGQRVGAAPENPLRATQPATAAGVIPGVASASGAGRAAWSAGSAGSATSAAGVPTVPTAGAPTGQAATSPPPGRRRRRSRVKPPKLPQPMTTQQLAATAGRTVVNAVRLGAAVGSGSAFASASGAAGAAGAASATVAGLGAIATALGPVGVILGGVAAAGAAATAGLWAFDKVVRYSTEGYERLNATIAASRAQQDVMRQLGEMRRAAVIAESLSRFEGSTLRIEQALKDIGITGLNALLSIADWPIEQIAQIIQAMAEEITGINQVDAAQLIQGRMEEFLGMKAGQLGVIPQNFGRPLNPNNVAIGRALGRAAKVAAIPFNPGAIAPNAAAGIGAPIGGMGGMGIGAPGLGARIGGWIGNKLGGP